MKTLAKKLTKPVFIQDVKNNKKQDEIIEYLVKEFWSGQLDYVFETYLKYYFKEKDK